MVGVTEVRTVAIIAAEILDYVLNYIEKKKDTLITEAVVGSALQYVIECLEETTFPNFRTHMIRRLQDERRMAANVSQTITPPG